MKRNPLDLTPREKIVMEHIARGKTATQTAAVLGLSKRTVDYHLYNVYSKLGVNNRLAACHALHAAGVIAFGGAA